MAAHIAAIVSEMSYRDFALGLCRAHYDALRLGQVTVGSTAALQTTAGPGHHQGCGGISRTSITRRFASARPIR